MRHPLIDTISTEKIVAILRGIPTEKLEPAITALYNGGIRILEITFNQKSETKLEDTASAIRLANHCFRICMQVPAQL